MFKVRRKQMIGCRERKYVRVVQDTRTEVWSRSDRWGRDYIRDLL